MKEEEVKIASYYLFRSEVIKLLDKATGDKVKRLEYDLKIVDKLIKEVECETKRIIEKKD